MIRILFFAFLFYLAYRLIFDFIIPVYKTTKQVKKGFREMQEKMQQHASQYMNTPQQNVAPSKAGHADDYIDFEEVK